MTKTNRILLMIFALVLLLISFIVFKSKKVTLSSQNNNQVKNQLMTQQKEENNVTVEVTPKTLEAGKNPVFDLNFNTHSVDLDFDITKISSVVDNKGNVLNSSVWKGSGSGGHHRSGTLSFNVPLSQIKSAELIIKNIAGIAERKFRWQL